MSGCFNANENECRVGCNEMQQLMFEWNGMYSKDVLRACVMKMKGVVRCGDAIVDVFVK
jgi:hypothetical protein